MMQRDEALLSPLEDAPSGATFKAKLPRRKLSRATLALLILLRIYVILAIPVVAYAFVRALSAH
jgi:hypothetical protein